MAKKILLSLLFIAGFGAYIFYSNSNQGASTGTAGVILSSAGSGGAPATSSGGRYADGTYTGSVADAYYGNVQVEAVVSNGRLADVKFLQYPNDRSTSRMINQQAMPQLTQEAIQAQSANVNGVSGASDTSAAFDQSLASALGQARA